MLTGGAMHGLGAWLAILVGLALVPLAAPSAYVLHVLILGVVFAMLASSWNLVVGYTGIFSFAHQAFFGVGAYGSALLVLNAQISPWLGLLCGGVIATGLALFIGLPVLRIRSLPHMAIVTLAFGEIVRILTSNMTWLTRGELGLFGIKPLANLTLPFAGTISFSPANRTAYYYTGIALFALT